MRLGWIALLLPLAACDKLVDTYEGVTAPIVAQGLVLGIEPPPSEVDLTGSDFASGASVTVFLATAEEAQNIEDAPVDDGEVSLSGGNLGNLEATNLGDGAYQVGPDPTLEYQDNATWTITAETSNDTSTADVTLPAAANFTFDQSHTASQPITLDVTGQGFTDVLVVVMDNASGDSTYDNRPQGIRELYDRSRNNTPLTTVEIPGSAFPGQSIYAIGVAGLNHTTADDLEFMNTLLSSVSAGKMRFTAISTLPAE